MDQGSLRREPSPLKKAASLVIGVLAAWLVYDFVVLVVTIVAVADSGRKVARGDWEVVGALAAVPLVLLVVTVVLRLRAGHLIPESTSGRAGLGAHALGVLGLAAAIALPAVAWWSYFNPHAEIIVDNRTHYASSIQINVDGGNACTLSQLVAPETKQEVAVVFTELSCWGDKPTSLEVLSALGTWACDWAEAKSHEPLVITEDSPGCAYTSYKPGILRQPPTTGGPSFSSPPQ